MSYSDWRLAARVLNDPEDSYYVQVEGYEWAFYMWPFADYLPELIWNGQEATGWKLSDLLAAGYIEPD